MTTRNCDLLSSLGALWELLRELIKSAHTYIRTQEYTINYAVKRLASMFKHHKYGNTEFNDILPKIICTQRRKMFPLPSS